MKWPTVLCSCLLMSASFAQDMSEEYAQLEELLPFDGFGWFAKENENKLRQLIKEREVYTVVELGSFLGCSTRFIAEQLPEGGVVYAVDHWLGSAEHQTPARKDVYHKLPTLYEQFLSNVIHKGLCDKIIPLRMSTLEAVYVVPQDPDLVYVDAAHDFESVLKDLEAWFPRVQGHGILCGDDWLWGKNTPVQKAVIRFAKQHNLKCASHGNFWWLIEQ